MTIITTEYSSAPALSTHIASEFRDEYAAKAPAVPQLCNSNVCLSAVQPLQEYEIPSSKCNTHRLTQSNPDSVSGLFYSKGNVLNSMTVIKVFPEIDTRSEPDPEDNDSDIGDADSMIPHSKSEPEFTTGLFTPEQGFKPSRISLMSGPGFVTVSPEVSNISIATTESVTDSVWPGGTGNTYDTLRNLPEMRQKPEINRLQNILNLTASLFSALKRAFTSLIAHDENKHVMFQSGMVSENTPYISKSFLSAIKPLDLSAW